MTLAELTSLEARQARVVEQMDWLRERIKVVRAELEKYGSEFADLQGGIELLRLELRELSEALEGEV